MFKTFSHMFSLCIVACIFILAVYINNSVFKGIGLDLTEQKVYSLSLGTKTLLSEIEEPVNLYFFFSDTNSTGMTRIRDYAARVKSMLEEYERISDGKISLEIIDPQPFSEAEDKAATFGLSGASAGAAQDTIYFGLAGTNSIDDVKVIGFFDPQKESFLEYDISNLVYQLSLSEPVQLTLITDINLAGGQNPMTGQMTQANVLYQQLQEFFEVELLSNSASEVPENTEVLMLLHPQNLSQPLLYSIDQYLMSGGKTMVLVDPHFESDELAMMGTQGVNQSSLPLLESYGIVSHTNKAVLDGKTGLEIRDNQGNIVRHLGYLGLTKEQINDQDITTADLDSINGASFGYLQKKPNSKVRQSPLLLSSKESGLVDAEEYISVRNAKDYGKLFENKNTARVLAARYSGQANSHFTELELTDANMKNQNFIASTNQLNLVVFADVDITADRFWVQQSNFFGQTVFSPFANNGDMLINMLENLGGSEGLIGIRSRGTYARPFEKVQELKAQAEERFREQEQRLQSQLEQTEAQLTQIQSQFDSVTFSTEQEQAIEQFTQQKIEIRKSLRDVQFQLNKDINFLGNWLKIINIVLLPLIIVFFLFIFVKLVRRKSPPICAEVD
ncbi:Gldg family protein [Glaciecola petra]|uniref:Gldg family protein n=1 Tax=Glaciecola petra TaxID=3075602 RepID=A0ABU2ZT87_9ALTE|nr:Gldg family protein [Aestuariibacter sp. P117]MDT0595848.1 Gldg family protein [Aestuariibacter sp. P117]